MRRSRSPGSSGSPRHVGVAKAPSVHPFTGDEPGKVLSHRDEQESKPHSSCRQGLYFLTLLALSSGAATATALVIQAIGGLSFNQSVESKYDAICVGGGSTLAALCDTSQLDDDYAFNQGAELYWLSWVVGGAFALGLGGYLHRYLGRRLSKNEVCCNSWYLNSRFCYHSMLMIFLAGLALLPGVIGYHLAVGNLGGVPKENGLATANCLASSTGCNTTLAYASPLSRSHYPVQSTVADWVENSGMEWWVSTVLTSVGAALVAYTLTACCGRRHGDRAQARKAIDSYYGSTGGSNAVSSTESSSSGGSPSGSQVDAIGTLAPSRGGRSSASRLVAHQIIGYQQHQQGLFLVDVKLPGVARSQQVLAKMIKAPGLGGEPPHFHFIRFLQRDADAGVEMEEPFRKRRGLGLNPHPEGQ